MATPVRAEMVALALLTMACVASRVHAGSLMDAPPPLPQGPDGRKLSIWQVTTVENFHNPASHQADHRKQSDASGIMVGPPARPQTLKTPENSFIVFKMKIKFKLCREAGVFSMFQECEYFYFCIPNSGVEGGFEQIIAVCGDGYAFDQKQQNCVRRDCVSSQSSDDILYDPGLNPPKTGSSSSIGPPGRDPAMSFTSPIINAVQVPSWFSKEPVWFRQKPEWFRTPPIWYDSPPSWINGLPTTSPATITKETYKKQIRPGVEIRTDCKKC